MRIWDISPRRLCNQHLFGEHRELHAIFTILTQDKKGYRHHPETQRWQGKLKALYLRHEQLVKEIDRRGYQHHSPLDKKLARGRARQNKFIHTKQEQKIILKHKNCPCPYKN